MTLLIILLLALMIITVPAAVLIFIIGLRKHHPWWGFGLGFLPIILFAFLLVPGLAYFTKCPAPPAPCEAPGLIVFLGIGVTALYLFVYVISAVVIFLIYRTMFDPQHAIVHKPAYKAAILTGIVLVILVGLGIVVLNPRAIFEALTNATLATLQILH